MNLHGRESLHHLAAELCCKKRRLSCARFLIAIILLFSAALPSHAKIAKVRVAYQYGLVYLPFMVMRHDQLIEKHAKASGLDKLKVEYVVLSGGSVMNTALLSGQIQFAVGGFAPFLTAWSKTKGTRSEMKGVAGFAGANMYLNTRDPKLNSLKDIGPNDRIAIPAIKVSAQALVLEMAAAQTFGPSKYNKFDPLTVALPNPDGMAALISGSAGITANFTAAPFSNEELKHPGIHTILTSYQVLGGTAILDIVWTTSKFHQENPKTYNAFLSALKEAIDFIHKDKQAAAEIYKKTTKSKYTVKEILEMLDKSVDGLPDLAYMVDPRKITKYSDFMYSIGAISHRPNSWKDLFFPEAHGFAGS